MEKLIELLNEYEKENWRNFEVKEIWMTFRNNDLMVISKRYWFIKRLVQNNKININKEWDDYEETNLYCNTDFFQLQQHYSDYESTLMLLAISDNPIDLLCEIIKN